MPDRQKQLIDSLVKSLKSQQQTREEQSNPEIVIPDSDRETRPLNPPSSGEPVFGPLKATDDQTE